jgi:ABC-2 type transport system permease protein
MFEMIKAELFKLRKRRMTWILLVILIAFYCLTFFTLNAIASNPPHQMPQPIIDSMKDLVRFPGAFNMIFSTAQNIGALLLIILVASAIGNEYGWGSMRQLLTKKGIRYQYLITKLTSLIIITIIGLIIAVIVGFFIALITSNSLGTINWDFMTASFVGGLFRNFGWTLFSLLVYILLAAFFAFLGRSVLVGIGGALGYYFIESLAIILFSLAGADSTLAKIPDYLIGPNSQALLPSTEMSAGPFASSGTPPSTLHAAITIAVYCIVLLAASWYLFRKRDITD